jgi:[acyl-carrier-protein] S-malonyltransferase
MEEAVPAGQGTMAAVLGMELEKVEAVCTEASAAGAVEVANINSPGQIVISGSKGGVLEAINAFRKNGARKVVPLAVSGPFHSSLMEPVAAIFAKDLAALGVGRFVEVGPGRVLTGLMKKIDKKAHVHYVEDGPSLEKFAALERKE